MKKKTFSRREHIFRFLAGGKIKAQIVFGVTVANESLRNVQKKIIKELKYITLMIFIVQILKLKEKNTVKNLFFCEKFLKYSSL